MSINSKTVPWVTCYIHLEPKIPVFEGSENYNNLKKSRKIREKKVFPYPQMEYYCNRICL